MARRFTRKSKSGASEDRPQIVRLWHINKFDVPGIRQDAGEIRDGWPVMGHGPLALRWPDPGAGDVFLTTDTEQHFECCVDGIWIEIAQGVPGPSGSIGPQGSTGPQGSSGSQGPPGPSGSVEEHSLLSETHPDTAPGVVTRGDLVLGNITPEWDKLAIGGSGSFLKSDGVDPAWANLGIEDLPTHNLLSAPHPDTIPGDAFRGDLALVNSVPKWAKLAVGANGEFLKSDGTDPSWNPIIVGDLPAHKDTHKTGGGDALTVDANSQDTELVYVPATYNAAVLNLTGQNSDITWTDLDLTNGTDVGAEAVVLNWYLKLTPDGEVPAQGIVELSLRKNDDVGEYDRQRFYASECYLGEAYAGGTAIVAVDGEQIIEYACDLTGPYNFDVQLRVVGYYVRIPTHVHNLS